MTPSHSSMSSTPSSTNVPLPAHTHGRSSSDAQSQFSNYSTVGITGVGHELITRDPSSGKAKTRQRAISTSDSGGEQDKTGPSSYNARRKKKEYAQSFRDKEKELFHALRERLFPRDPHARRAECLQKGTLSVHTIRCSSVAKTTLNCPQLSLLLMSWPTQENAKSSAQQRSMICTSN